MCDSFISTILLTTPTISFSLSSPMVGYCWTLKFIFVHSLFCCLTNSIKKQLRLRLHCALWQKSLSCLIVIVMSVLLYYLLSYDNWGWSHTAIYMPVCLWRFLFLQFVLTKTKIVYCKLSFVPPSHYSHHFLITIDCGEKTYLVWPVN